MGRESSNVRPLNSSRKRFRDLFNGLKFEDSRPMYSELKADGQDVFKVDLIPSSLKYIESTPNF